MIRLKLKTLTGSSAPWPFLVCVAKELEELVDPKVENIPAVASQLRYDYRATVTDEGLSTVELATHGATFNIFGVKAEDLIGDVLLIFPDKDYCIRLIRSASKHNTLLVTEQCDQMCVMCSQPPKAHHFDLFQYYGDAIKMAPNNCVVGISGGEPLLYKAQLIALIEDVYSVRPDISYHVLTNAQHFEASDAGWLAKEFMRTVCWGVPIYSHVAETHNAIVGKEGAFECLIENIQLVSLSQAALELRTVVMENNHSDLPALAQFITTHFILANHWAIMQLENIGYARKNWKTIFFDSSVDFADIGKAVDIAELRGLKTLLYNFPLCSVPPGYRSLAVRSISDWKQTYLDECRGCTEMERCGGFFEWYRHDSGFSRITVQ